MTPNLFRPRTQQELEERIASVRAQREENQRRLSAMTRPPKRPPASAAEKAKGEARRRIEIIMEQRQIAEYLSK